MDQTLARQEKHKYLASAGLRNISSEAQRIPIQLAGVYGEVITHGPYANENADFLRKYYEKFCTLENKKSEFYIYYTSPKDARAHHEHLLWSEDPHHDFQIEKVGAEFKIVQRDFIGQLDSGKNTIFGLGPKLSYATTDSIDNLLNILIFQELPKHKALVLHAAGVLVDGFAYVFFGNSEVGKSTLAENAHNIYKLPIIAGDQLYLRLENNELIAYASPNMIGQMKRENLSWHTGPVAVRGLFHLTRNQEPFVFQKKTAQELLGPFLRQIFYRSEFSAQENILDLSIKYLSSPCVTLGEVSYTLETNPWVQLKKTLYE